MSTTAKRPWLTADEERAWRAFRRIMITVQTATARDLADQGLSEADYEVLSTLSELPEHTSTLHAQAAKMGWSRSRLSRQASRMAERGLIDRRPDPQDGRGCFLVLTSEGFSVLRRVAPAHVASVRRHFTDRLTAQDLRSIERIASRITNPDI
jgi:DNA-binding MarR family transcriptional regulator